MTEEVTVFTVDGEEFDLPFWMIEKCGLLYSLWNGGEQLQVSLTATELQFALTFMDMFGKDDYDYDPTHLNIMIHVADTLQLNDMVEFCSQEVERFEKARNNIISWDEFCIHQKKNDFWIIIDNGIYDITKWITCYPGTNQCPHPGSTTPLQGYKKDSTYFFEMYHATNDCYRLMKKYFIGVIDPKDISKIPPLPHNPSKEFYETLHSFSKSWMET